ncbi:hypothetical protein BDF19DRAFT_442262 [Syncephalis fuscata]|nr:hypothetical protein BDF19DRAFT_442262 [Syncephalis fuscata]
MSPNGHTNDDSHWTSPTTDTKEEICNNEAIEVKAVNAMESDGVVADGATTTAVVPRRRKPSQAESVASHGTHSEHYMPGSMELEMTLEFMRQSWPSSNQPDPTQQQYQERDDNIEGTAAMDQEELNSYSANHQAVNTNSNDAADRSGSSGHSESETDSIADIAVTSEAVRRLQRQVSFNQSGGGGNNSGGSALLKKSVMNRAAEASNRLSSASITRSFSPTPGSPSSMAAPETFERPRNTRASSTSSFASSVHSGSNRGSVGMPMSFQDMSSAHHYQHRAPPSIASHYRDSMTQMTDITGKIYAHSVQDAIHTSPYLHLPLPDYNADDLEEEYYLRRRFAREMPAGALLFAFGFILCPLWWIGALLSIPGETAAVSEEGKEPEESVPAGQGTGEALRHRAMLHRRWRLLNRIMSGISFILIAATVGLLLWWYYRY